jgi:hypothetical protein
MAKVEIYGHSDDCIEIDGDIHEEFYLIDDEPNWLAFSDGSLLSIDYTKDGTWRIHRMSTGTAAFSKTEATDSGDDYTDKATLEGDLSWVIHGKNMAKAAQSTK